MYALKTLQAAFASLLEKEAAQIGTFLPANLYQPIQYTFSMGGKRLRPVMVLMACDLFGGNIEEALYAALGIETFHNFTLLHDDIMDQASLRRNRETVHKKYNENIAILSGDAMSNLAFRYLLRTESDARYEILCLFAKTAAEIYEGQQYDMDFEESMTVSIDDYLKMIRLKTAVLIACSLKTGALIGHASPQDASHLYEFGIHLGLAFQLHDDLLDVYADQDKFGKKTGGDIVSNKKTFLLLKALELASSEQKKELLVWISGNDFDPDEKIASVKRIYTQVNIQQITLDMMGHYYRKAISELEIIAIDAPRKEELLLLAKKMMKREK
jgi:geranylgeranyl diphosphate synthase type II